MTGGRSNKIVGATTATTHLTRTAAASTSTTAANTITGSAIATTLRRKAGLRESGRRRSRGLQRVQAGLSRTGKFRRQSLLLGAACVLR